MSGRRLIAILVGVVGLIILAVVVVVVILQPGQEPETVLITPSGPTEAGGTQSLRLRLHLRRQLIRIFVWWKLSSLYKPFRAAGR
jgi:hypothetical protein